MYRRNPILMSAIGAMLSAGAAAIAHAFERIEEKFHLRHQHTEQVCTFDTADQVHTFLSNTEDADRDNWLPHDPSAPAGAPVAVAVAVDSEPQATAEQVADPAPAASTVVSVDLAQLREAVKADVAAEDAQTAAAPAADPAPATTDAPSADQPATDTTAA